MVNIAHFKLFFKCVAAIKIKMSEYFPRNGNVSQLQRLICFLYFIGNKIRVCEIYISLHTIFIYIAGSGPTFLELGLSCILKIKYNKVPELI